MFDVLIFLSYSKSKLNMIKETFKIHSKMMHNYFSRLNEVYLRKNSNVE